MNTASRRALLAEAHRITTCAAAHFDDRVERLSGWAHNFVCPDCASQLDFNPDMEYNPPHNLYTCPNCGKPLTLRWGRWCPTADSRTWVSHGNCPPMTGNG